MASRTERLLVRILIGAALCVAVLASALTPAPPSLPAATFGQVGLYRLEVALLVFYGCLLLITPAFSGLIRGRLPIEISTRGARFAEGAERSVVLDETAIRKLEATTDGLARALAESFVEIQRLSKAVEVTTHNRE